MCGMRGYKAISGWANSLGAKARERFRCRREKGRYVVPSEYVIRDILIRVDLLPLDRALQRWNEAYGEKDESLAIDGKTMCNAIDEQGYQTHILSAIGHQPFLDGRDDGHPDEEIFEELGQAGGSGLLGMGKEFIDQEFGLGMAGVSVVLSGGLFRTEISLMESGKVAGWPDPVGAGLPVGGH